MYKKGILCFDIQFFMDKIGKLKKKRKMSKNLTLPHRDLNPGFLNKSFPPKI
jgi:hypothetical protein